MFLKLCSVFHKNDFFLLGGLVCGKREITGKLTDTCFTLQNKSVEFYANGKPKLTLAKMGARHQFTDDQRGTFFSGALWLRYRPAVAKPVTACLAMVVTAAEK